MLFESLAGILQKSEISLKQEKSMYSKYNDTVASPARQMFAITASPAPLAVVPKALRADGPGSVTFRPVDSEASVTVTLQAGEILPVRVSHVTAFTVSALHGLA